MCVYLLLQYKGVKGYERLFVWVTAVLNSTHALKNQRVIKYCCEIQMGILNVEM